MTDLTTRAAALLAAADKMTPGEWVTLGGAIFVSAGPVLITDSIRSALSDMQSLLNDTGIVALHNDAPALIRELLAENERLVAELETSARVVLNKNADCISLRARVAELEAPTPIDEAKDAGPSPFQGRTTRRDEDDDKEYNFMMSHYEGKN